MMSADVSSVKGGPLAGLLRTYRIDSPPKLSYAKDFSKRRPASHVVIKIQGVAGILLPAQVVLWYSKRWGSYR